MNSLVNNLPHEFLPTPGVGHGKINVTDAVLDVAPATLELGENTRYLEIQVETAAVRVTVNGTDPDATTGFRQPAGTIVRMSRAEWLGSKWIREGATSAVLQVAQYTRP